ncbi:glutamate racemase, partial [gut metagenome]
CPGLMECVEAGEMNSPATLALLHRYIDPLLTQGVDTLVLGCTHYPFLTPAIRRIAGPEVTLIDPAPAVARQLERRLTEADLLTDQEKCGTETFYSTDANPLREKVLQTLWNPKSRLQNIG